jgi:hypothetical protein
MIDISLHPYTTGSAAPSLLYWLGHTNTGIKTQLRASVAGVIVQILCCFKICGPWQVVSLSISDHLVGYVLEGIHPSNPASRGLFDVEKPIF